MRRIPTYLYIGAGLVLTAAASARAQDPPASGTDPLARLVAEALERSPRLAASRAEREAYDARIPQAGAWEDPVLTLGFANLLATSFDFGDDFMTMKMVQLGQRIPLPGQIGHARAAASRRAVSAEHMIEATRVEVAVEVKAAYAELYYRDRALDIVDRNLRILAGLEDVTHTRYATGVGSQPAVLRAGLEIDGLETQRVQLVATRHAALARLNALRDRPAATPVEGTPYPPLLLAVTERRGPDLAFVSALNVAGAERSLAAPPGVPPLDSLVALAIEGKPQLRAHVARIGAQEETVALARALRWPAPQLSVGYGQRDGFPDMVNASISFRLPVFLGAKQESAVREEAAILARERAMHGRMVAEIERDVTAGYSRVLDALGQLERYDRGILQRSEATLGATLAAYRSGAEDFLALLDSQTRLYQFELERHRRLADLLAAWAELERAVGREIEP
jgi:outer membrane protein TolC